MKTCKNCGAEIPDSAAYCDICGALCSKRLEVKPPAEQKRIEKNRARRKKTAERILLAFGICVGAFIVIAVTANFISMKKYEMREKARDLTGWETVVSPEAYEKLDIGMSYEEIAGIIGGEGKKVEDSKYVTRYMWPGEYYANREFGYLSVDFYRDGNAGTEELKADYIEEKDILDGAETYETYMKIYDFDYADIDAPLVTKKQVSQISEGMSYEKVCAVLGEGKLCRSSTITDAYASNRYETYVWRCRYSGDDSEYELRFENGILKYYSDWMIDYID